MEEAPAVAVPRTRARAHTDRESLSVLRAWYTYGDNRDRAHVYRYVVTPSHRISASIESRFLLSFLSRNDIVRDRWKRDI